MNDWEKKATVITEVGGHRVELNGFYRDEDHDKCHIYVAMWERQWVSLGGRAHYLFGVRFLNGKMELLFDERPRRYHDPQAWEVRECHPADEDSSKVLRELFEKKAYEGQGVFVKPVPLAWPWSTIGAG